MSVKRALLGVAVVVAVAVVLIIRKSEPPVPSLRLSAVLVTIDTLRADRVGRGLTPSIDGLAARGVSFRNVRATAPLTLPSHVSLMTGTIPPVHGVRENGVVFDRKTPTLARVFRDDGYRTAAFVGAYVLNRRFGLDDGFETYDDAVRRDASRAEQLEAERPAGEVLDAALAWVSERPAAEPFFLWVHLYDPHAPYAPPREFLAKANGSAYDGEVAYADAQVGRLLEALSSHGLLDSTIVAVTGDHGEALGEHGEQTHGMLAYDSTLRVPLVVAGPGVEAAANQPCHWELAPMLLRLAGSDRRPPGMAAGVSTECASYSETRYPRRAGWHALSATADSRWKLILSSEQELYDVAKDPGETENVAARHPAVVQGMAGMLARMQPPAPKASTVAPEAAERLRALGYVSGSAAIVSDDPKAPNPARVIDAWTAFERAFALMPADPRSAARALKALVSAHPSAPVFASTYAQALKESGDARGAVAIYRQAVARWPQDPALFHDLAVAAREAGETAEAARAEQAALALDGSSAMARNGLGLLHADAGRYREAAEAFEAAANGDPTNPSYWANLGNARRALEDVAGAEAAYRRSLDADPEFADALNGLGTLYVQSGRAAEAVPLFERALRRDSRFHEARLNLGIAYQESGQREKAASAYRELLATAPRSAQRERQAAAALLKQVSGAGS